MHRRCPPPAGGVYHSSSRRLRLQSLLATNPDRITIYIMLIMAVLTVPCNVAAAYFILPRIRTIAGRKFFVISLVIGQVFSWLIIYAAYRIMYPA